MEIRKATEADIPEIVSLLKVSLGESLMPKSERYWRWKHLDNPFGASPVLLAIEKNEIAGVRAFMRWSWSREGKIVEAVRAVDTATRPGFQGKGIFRKLTLTLVEKCTEQGYGLVFNTPNEKSMPGYLKMGWHKAGRVPVIIQIRKPFSMGFQYMRNAKGVDQADPDHSIEYFLSHPGLSQLLTSTREVYKSVFTSVHTVQSLQWRYGSVPVAAYKACGTENDKTLDGLIIFRTKTTRLGKELRITDVFIKSAEAIHELRHVFYEKIREQRPDYITFAGWQNGLPVPSLLNGLLCFKTHYGSPMVTVRQLKLNSLDDFIGFKNWTPSLGDLELF